MRTTRYLIALAALYFAAGYTIGRIADSGAKCPLCRGCLQESRTLIRD